MMTVELGAYLGYSDSSTILVSLTFYQLEMYHNKGCI